MSSVAVVVSQYRFGVGVGVPVYYLSRSGDHSILGLRGLELGSFSAISHNTGLTGS